ncbi:MAG: hypothetical protein KJ970_12615 [Candidatus Eisenbacteria bacterium]|uniref:Ankyrin repeat domain-containing protein n=1 Tax=Eiseniibacteriota bacterium TaxID=2212470 RepID=A0A948RWG7_UNCEI|nr:hypothetical protein [Candidatus Eisenbacteria bacterium]
MAKKQTKPATKKDSKKAKAEQKTKDAKTAPETAEIITPDPITTAPAPDPEPALKPNVTEPLVVFAFRLTRAERDLIHKATGSGKATKFVKGVIVAAARGDLDTIKAIVENGTT